MIELKVGEYVYIPSIGVECYKIIKVDRCLTYYYISMLEDGELTVKRVSVSSTYRASEKNKKLLDELTGLTFSEPPPIKKADFEYEQLLYVPELGCEIYEVSVKLGVDCSVTCFSYDENDTVLFRVNKYNAYPANRENRILLNKLYNKEFHPTIYEDSVKYRTNPLTGDECVLKMLADGIKNILCITCYREIIIVTGVDDVESFIDVKNKTYAMIAPLSITDNGIEEIRCDDNGSYYTIPFVGRF